MVIGPPALIRLLTASPQSARGFVVGQVPAEGDVGLSLNITSWRAGVIQAA